MAFADHHPTKLAQAWVPVTIHRRVGEGRLGEGMAGRIGIGTEIWIHIGRDRILGQDHHGGVGLGHTPLDRTLDHLPRAKPVGEQATGDGTSRQGVVAEAERGEVRATVPMIATAIVAGVRAGIGVDAEGGKWHSIVGVLSDVLASLPSSHILLLLTTTEGVRTSSQTTAVPCSQRIETHL